MLPRQSQSPQWMEYEQSMARRLKPELGWVRCQCVLWGAGIYTKINLWLSQAAGFIMEVSVHLWVVGGDAGRRLGCASWPCMSLLRHEEQMQQVLERWSPPAGCFPLGWSCELGFVFEGGGFSKFLLPGSNDSHTAEVLEMGFFSRQQHRAEQG